MRIDWENEVKITLVSSWRELEDISTLSELKIWVQDIEEKVPEKHRSQIQFDIDYWYEDGVSLDVYYVRPKTTEDRKQEAASFKAAKRRARKREQAEYERLKAKFE